MALARLGSPAGSHVPSVSSQVLGYGLPPVLRALVERHQSLRAKTTADQSLARRLRARLREEAVDASGLSFYVHDGAISIYGTVGDAQARERVLSTATRIPGVRRIVDHLRVVAEVAAA